MNELMIVEMRSTTKVLLVFLILSLMLCSCSSNKDETSTENKVASKEIVFEDQGLPDQISFISSNEGWGVLSHGGALGSLIMHMKDRKWRTIEMDISFMPTMVNAHDEDDIWVAGSEHVIEKTDNYEKTISVAVTLHFNGDEWTKNQFEVKRVGKHGMNPAIMSVSIPKENEVYAIGSDGQLFSLNNEEWTLSCQVDDSGFLLCDSKTSGVCWVVGKEIYKCTGGEVITEPIVADDMNDRWLNWISMVDENDGWVVGDKGLILHYDGNSWQEYPSPTDDYFVCVDMNSKTSGWMISDTGGVFKYDGESWQQVEHYENTTLESISAVSDTEAWATGKSVTVKGNTTISGKEYYIKHIKWDWDF